MPRLCLLLIDPHASFREAARSYLLRCRDLSSVETAANYNEGLLLYKQYFPDLILIDREIFSTEPGLIEALATLKHSNPQLDILALYLFEEDGSNRGRLLSPLVGGIIYKENFAEGLFAYLASRNNQHTSAQTGSLKEVD